jgi:DNA/RNA-binding domain of Phe-tRNA-synthetase-like protein
MKDEEGGTTNMFTVAEAFKAAYPTALAGVLAMRNVSNPDSCPELDSRKEDLERDLRARFAGQDAAVLKSLPPVQAYNAFYKHFGKTYHVQLQLESVALKGKSIPRVAALVEAMFVAELKNLLLTAGHDLDAVQTPVTLGVADGSQMFTMLNGREQLLKAGDMMISDGQGVISSVLYGPDQRTRIVSATRRVLFTVYAPAGIGEPMLRQHLQDIQSNVRLIAPEAETELLEVYGAGK